MSQGCSGGDSGRASRRPGAEGGGGAWGQSNETTTKQPRSENLAARAGAVRARGLPAISPACMKKTIVPKMTTAGAGGERGRARGRPQGESMTERKVRTLDRVIGGIQPAPRSPATNS